MKVVISRAYVSRSAQTSGPGAYLVVELEPADLEGCRRLDPARMVACFDPSCGGSNEPAGDVVTVARCSNTAASRLAALWKLGAEGLLREAAATESVEIWVTAVGDGGPVTMTLLGSDPELARRAGALAAKMIEALLALTSDGTTPAADLPGFATERAALARYAAACRTSPTSDAIVHAAIERDIPVIRFDRWPLRTDEASVNDHGLMLQLGYGKYGKRLMQKGLLPAPPTTYELLVDRQRIGDALANADIPSPVRDPEFTHLNQRLRAVRTAERIGYPVVVKARLRTAGRSVYRGITDSHGVASAYDALASRYGRQVVIERDVAGDSFRCLVIGGTVVAARRHSMFESAAAAANDGGLPTEGEDHDVLPLMHPEILAMAVKAAAVFDAEIAAVDIVTLDIGRPLGATGGAVVDVAQVSDLTPYGRKGELPAAVASSLVDHLFPPGTASRVPIIAVTGTNGKTTTCRMTAKILQAAGYTVGLACTDGVYVDDHQLHSGLMSGITGALLVLVQPGIDIAVLETSRGNLVTRGLGFDRCAVAACTNVASDHLGSEGIETVEQMAALKRIVLESADDGAVINADDPNCLAMLPFLGTREICLVSLQPESEAISSHLASDGRIVQLRAVGGRPTIMLRRGEQEEMIAAVDDIPATWNGAARHNVENAMFAAALASEFGISTRTIRTALGAFACSIEDAPGRLNFYDRLPFRVLLDFAHNVDGFRALCDFLRKFDRSKRRHLVLFWPSDARRVPELLDAAQIVAPLFDRFICRDTIGAPEDSTGVVAKEVESALIQAGVPAAAVRVIPKLETAVEAVLREASPGDLVVITVGLPALAVWRQLDAYRLTLEMQSAQT